MNDAISTNPCRPAACRRLHRAALVAAGFLLVPGLMSDSLSASDPDVVQEWVTYYYLQPTPEQVPLRIKQLSSTGVFEQEGALPPLVAFMTEVFRQNPAQLGQWSEELAELPPQHRSYVWWALWNTELPEAQAALRARAGTDAEVIEKIMASKPIHWMSKNPTYPSDLDVLWATFMASGNPAAVEKIIDLLAVPLPEQGQPGWRAAFLLRNVAEWSLSSNIQQHKQVEQICRARLAQSSGLLRQVLAEVIRDAEEKAKRQGQP